MDGSKKISDLTPAEMQKLFDSSQVVGFKGGKSKEGYGTLQHAKVFANQSEMEAAGYRSISASEFTLIIQQMLARSSEIPKGYRSFIDRQISKIKQEKERKLTGMKEHFYGPEGSRDRIRNRSISTNIQRFSAEIITDYDQAVKHFAEKDQALLAAVSEDAKPQEIEKLLKLAASPNAENAEGKSALHVALEKNNLAAVALLIDYGADLHATDKDGNTLLHLATHFEMVDLLVQRAGKDKTILEAKNKQGQTPLAFLLSRNDPRFQGIANALFAAGADVNTVDNEGVSPIHRAAAFPGPQLEWLLAHGADPNKPTAKEGLRPLDFLVRSPGLRTIVRENAVGIKTVKKSELWLAIMGFIDLLIDKGAQVNLPDKNGKTALDYLRETKGDVEAFQKLREAKKVQEQAQSLRESEGGRRRTFTDEDFESFLKE